MATNKNITMKQFNGTDYDTLYPKTKVEQVEGAYAQQQILADSTKTLYGLGVDAVPNDVLNMLYPVINYAWKRRAAGYVEKRTAAPSDKRFYLAYGTNSVNCSRTVEYSAEIEINSTTGAISLKNPQTLTVPWTNGPTIAEVLKGKYVKNTFSSQDKIVFITASATITNDSSSSSYWVDVNLPSINVFIVSSEIVSTGDWSIVYAPSRNAYPDSGIVDGMEYAFLGKPLDNATLAAKIETGSYVGTGTYGGTNPIGLTTPGKPKFVFVAQKVQSASSARGYYFTAVVNQETAMVERVATDSTSTDAHFVQLSWGDKTVSWYSIANAERQLNTSGTEYVYAIFY